jgi:predicted nucleotidyltransferase component of viral defense system
MKEIIKEKLRAISSVEDKYNLLREYLQALVLKHVEEKVYLDNLAFVGGTSLRFLFDLKRFSEDLDFSLLHRKDFDFEKYLNSLEKSFNAWNIKVEFKPKTGKSVVSSFLKFPEIMFETGLTTRKEQKLFIKLEIDCNPPAGFSTEMSFNQKYFPMYISHYDIPSLFAGKLHAVLLRQYTKARDYYDLIWFLGKQILPNFIQLENAIFQTTGQKTPLNTTMLKEKLKERISSVNFKKVQNDLSVFLADKSELKYLNINTLNQLIDRL